MISYEERFICLLILIYIEYVHYPKTSKPGFRAQLGLSRVNLCLAPKSPSLQPPACCGRSVEDWELDLSLDSRQEVYSGGLRHRIEKQDLANSEVGLGLMAIIVLSVGFRLVNIVWRLHGLGLQKPPGQRLEEQNLRGVQKTVK